MMNFFKNFKESWNLVFTERKKVLLVMFFDFLFFFSLFLLGGIVMQQIVSTYGVLQEQASLINPGVLENSQESVNYLMGQLEGLQSILSRIFLMVALLVIGIFLLWCIFQGINWFITNSIISKRNILNFGNFLKLNIISLVWLVIIIIFFSLFSRGLINELSYQEKTGAGISILIFFFVVFYFLSIGYSLFLLKLNIINSIKSSFTLGIKKFYVLLPRFFLIIAFFIVASFILYFLRSLVWWFGIIGFLVFLVLIMWGRIFVLLSVKELCGRQDSNLRRH